MSIRYKTTRALYAEPVTIRPKEGIAADGANALRCVSCGAIFPASFENGAVTAILTLPAGEYEFEPATTDGETPVTLSGIDKLADGAESFDILIGGDKFASYVFKKSLAKPYLGPIATSFGGSYTREGASASQIGVLRRRRRFGREYKKRRFLERTRRLRHTDARGDRGIRGKQRRRVVRRKNCVAFSRRGADDRRGVQI